VARELRIDASGRVAASASVVIGGGGAMPCDLPGDLRRFRALTTGHVVVMGRLTYQSILDRLGHPLTGRTSIVVSRTLGDPGYPEGLVAASVPAALALAERLPPPAGGGGGFRPGRGGGGPRGRAAPRPPAARP